MTKPQTKRGKTKMENRGQKETPHHLKGDAGLMVDRSLIRSRGLIYLLSFVAV
jgi:hypothetical protein